MHVELTVGFLAVQSSICGNGVGLFFGQLSKQPRHGNGRFMASGSTITLVGMGSCHFFTIMVYEHSIPFFLFVVFGKFWASVFWELYSLVALVIIVLAANYLFPNISFYQGLKTSTSARVIS